MNPYHDEMFGLTTQKSITALRIDATPSRVKMAVISGTEPQQSLSSLHLLEII